MENLMSYFSLEKYINYDLNNVDEYIGWVWWSLQATCQVLNVIAFAIISCSKREKLSMYVYKQKWFSLIFMIACFVRAVWPRHDIERMCFFDSFLSTTIVGRTLATVAELCFISQMKIAFISLSKDLCEMERGHTMTHKLVQGLATYSWWVILIAQTCCWRCVTTGFTLWSALEESIWTFVMF